MDEAAGEGRLALQRCVACTATQYPPREFCSVCLSGDLVWTVTEVVGGAVLSTTVLHHSHDAATRASLPLRIGLVALDAGPTAICFVPHAAADARVRIHASLDANGRAVLTAR